MPIARKRTYEEPARSDDCRIPIERLGAGRVPFHFASREPEYDHAAALEACLERSA